MNTETRSSKQWEAFQYVSGELSAEESEQFELRMLNDAELCEAVSQVTLLSACIATSDCSAAANSAGPAASVARPAQQVGRFGRFAAAVISACCCLFLAIFLKQGLQIPDRSADTQVVTADEENAEILVETWAASFESDDQDVEASGEAGTEDLSVPDWMFAAIALSDVSDERHELSGDMEL